jgi:hypothetical protein
MLKHNKIDARDTLKYTLIVLGSLVAFLHLFSLTLYVNLTSTQTYQITTWFDLDSERNIPTVYSGLVIGCCALLCLFLSAQKSRSHERIRWAFLALLFFYLAFDEILVIHELFAEPIRDLLSIAGDSPLFHAWVIPAMMIAAGIGLLAFFIRHHSETSRLQRSVFIYIAILAAGVILLEILGTRFYFSTTFYKAGPVFIEEMFEITMSSLILYKLSSAINFKVSER